jgi:hypothetical protein
MTTEVCIHLPGVSLVNGPFPIGGGELAVPAFDQCFAMDGTFRDSDSHYSRSRHVFWRGAISMSERADEAEIVRAISSLRFLLHLSLMLQDGEPLSK